MSEPPDPAAPITSVPNLNPKLQTTKLRTVRVKELQCRKEHGTVYPPDVNTHGKNKTLSLEFYVEFLSRRTTVSKRLSRTSNRAVAAAKQRSASATGAHEMLATWHAA